MRRERPFLRRNTKFFQGAVDVACKSREICGGFNASPEDAWTLFIWEETHSSKIERDRSIGMHGGERRSNVAEFLRLHFADEFQSDMKVIRSHPPRLRRKRAKRREKLAETFPHCGRNLQCHEKAHRSRPFASVRRRLAAIVEKMDPHHVQRELRCMPANRFAVAGEAHAALFHSARMRNLDMYRANGFFFASP